MNKFELGDAIVCKVTGLKGIVTARVEYINGCIQYALTPPATENKYPDSVYIDQKQLDFSGEPAIQMKNELTGGPQMNCPKN